MSKRERSPKQEVLPHLVPVGCDVYPPGRALVQYVWLRVLDPEDDVERAGGRWVGGRVDAHDQVVDDVGWHAILDVGNDDADGRPRWREFLLAEGVAPGQPFLARGVYDVSYNTSVGLWDEELEVSVVARAPWPAAEVLAAWLRDSPQAALPGYLPCPECGADALRSSGFGCLGCVAGAEHDACEFEPLWDDGDEGACPACDVPLRAVVDHDFAYAVGVPHAGPGVDPARCARERA